jgi:hypothetical protein
MFRKDERWPAIAGGLVVAVALLGCGGERSVASKSAEAFREAQKRGETFGGSGHTHGHGAMTPDATNEPATEEAAEGGEHHGAHEHGAAEALAARGGHEGHGAHAAGPAQGHAAPGHAGHEAHGAAGAQPQGGEHAGHGTMPSQAPVAGAQQPESGHAGHAGHSASGGSMTPAAAAPAPVAVPPEQPAQTLRPDPLDAPAATSVLDAQRSAEMAGEMTGGHGGHGGHGAGTYRHVDVGRSQPPAAEPQHHDHGAAGPASEPEHGHEDSALYVCPMHPEVTSETPGTCPKCGMTLVQRRKE